MPGFDVELGRNKRRNGRPVPKPDTGDITAEEIIFPMVNMMMTGMARCGDGADFEWSDLDDVVVLQNSETVFRDRCDSAPQSLHVIAEDAGRGCDQLRGIDEMLSAAGMDVNCGTELRESPGRTGVIKMNMTDEDVPNVVSRSTNLPQPVYNIVEG